MIEPPLDLGNLKRENINVGSLGIGVMGLNRGIKIQVENRKIWKWGKVEI